MKEGRSLSELAAEIERRRDAKRDYLVDTGHLRMDPQDGGPKLVFQDTSYDIQRLAHRQIGDRVGIPAKYYDRLRDAAPDLLATNVNHWLTATPETRMIRTLDGRVRAFLSDRYQRIDNEDIAECVLPVLAEVPDIQFVSTEITSSRMYIKAVTPRVCDEVTVGDEVQAGVVISNSEVGLGAMTVSPLVLRLACSNGMALPDSTYRKSHVGARANKDENIYELLSDEAKQADDRAILLKIRDVVRAALNEAVFARTVDRLRDAKSTKLTGNPVAVVRELATKQGLDGTEEAGVLRYLTEGGDLSRYGLIQAVTRFAQDPSDYDRASELEYLGGKILDLPRQDWEVLQRAA